MKFALLTVVICTAAALGAAHVLAQDPTSTISGRVLVEGGGELEVREILVLPPGATQPIDRSTVHDFEVPLGAGGSFFVSNLAPSAGGSPLSVLQPGDYLLVPCCRGSKFVTPLAETVSFLGADGTLFQLPALRIHLGQSQSVIGIEIIVAAPEPLIFDVPGPVSGVPTPGADLVTPVDGASSDSPAYIGVAIAGGAVLLLGGGLVWRVRGRRAS